MRADLIFILCATLIAGCADRDKKGNFVDTPTSGRLKIAVDESLLPLIDAEEYAFESTYARAHVDVLYTTEQQAVDLLLKDSVKLIVITRALSEDEVNKLNQQKLKPHAVTMATSGTAVILHPANTDSVLTSENLKLILAGGLSHWNQLDPSSKLGEINVVFDQPNSGIIRHLRDSLMFSGELSSNCFAVKGNASVIDYVGSHPNALGLIDVSWISDRDDSTTNTFLKTVRVVALQHDSVYHQPYQAYLAQKQYPLLRKVIMISREARAGLASGFIAFAASDKGQRVVLKAGLVPATMPVRIVEVNNKPLNN